ncbi:class V aminotransferase [Neisseria dentiae]|uniref:Class V aminotransferase n=1 Tax=Neisseria dentiae TaxID=194197 RepID=A0A1X3DEI1_9NEIS|nr:aminotransferase class V-fold PLP-dependent enzyme [Neisseria dentiae]OSI18338.1 class V aminotransferase [Neisseria dentiae]QMT44525.1 alanine--glyoxylate aminotransferase family protein [Neisseria dentiae]STZ50221.1 2-aminoethylphosphonate--pyruvate transaminase [Neisseria dentiae]
MSTLPRPEIDSDGLLEYSVVYTDRALNHMSQKFQTALRYISATLKKVYGAQHAAVIPGSGTSGMEAVARQLARGGKCLIVRNGFFSYRWTQILEKGAIAADSKVFTARQADEAQAPFAPAPIEEVCAEIAAYRPAVVFAPHVETASGIMLPDGYIRQLAEAVHAVGGLLVIDSIASGCIWLDMEKLGIDVLVSAPQKGWSGSPCCGLVMLNDAAYQKVQQTESDSFALDLKKWLQIMEAFENGGHAYHATPPTDALMKLHDVMKEAEAIGFGRLQAAQTELGAKIRALLAGAGYPSVAAAGFEAPGVVVSYTANPDIQNGKAFVAQGMQIAAGVPLQCGERSDFQTFRLGLFGLDKLQNIDRTVETFARVLGRV